MKAMWLAGRRSVRAAPPLQIVPSIPFRVPPYLSAACSGVAPTCARLAVKLRMTQTGLPYFLLEFAIDGGGGATRVI